MTLDEYLPRAIAVLRLAPKTRENYLGAYGRYVRGALGPRLLAEIEPADIRQVLQPLSPPSAYQTLMMLKSVFREAVADGLVVVAPTDRIKTERATPRPGKFIKWEQIVETDFGKYNDHIRFLALHGLRWSEAVALEESDIRDGFVHVWRSSHGPTKSRAGVRRVPYLGHFAPFPTDRRGIAKALKPFGVNIHSLRKTYAYLLKSQGVHVTTAQRLLGHASPHLTLAVYTLVLDEEIELAGDALRLALGFT